MGGKIEAENQNATKSTPKVLQYGGSSTYVDPPQLHREDAHDKILKIESVQLEYLNIPTTLRFATATSAFQIEGAWNVSDKGENLWDHIAHEYDNSISDNSTADIACDSYNLYKRDVEMLVELGVEYYRFSISWSRLLPTGFSNVISEDGKNYYNNLINELLKNNIKPIVTMSHWDIPFAFQKFGGWANELVVDRFEDYARVLFELFGDRVKEWITFNEPQVMCIFTDHMTGKFISTTKLPGVVEYLCLHNILKSHARAYHLYNDTFKPTQKGKLGAAIHLAWGEPESDSQEDIENADILMQFFVGWFAHPIFSEEGDYPEIMRKKIAERSKLQGFSTSRLPTFTPEEVKYISGTFDYMGFNYYCAFIPNTAILTEGPSFYDDMGFEVYQKFEWDRPLPTWFAVYAKAFRPALNWAVKQYGNHEIYILENGYANTKGLVDDHRIKYYTDHLKYLLEAIDDGCNVTLYTAWTLMDNFEWNVGYM
ncbi:myrosinase 1-like [Arctopsyche grandis]|uniref:myrosinase 1-like n=1 Tax=Arctopsyche grandis TaxID=121162 RepID=UPI00406D9FBA